MRGLCETYAAYLALGHEDETRSGARFVRSRVVPLIHDANLVQQVRAEAPAAIEAVMEAAEAWLAGYDHRQVITDPLTPAALSASLALAGYTPRPTLQLLLEGPLAGPPPVEAEIRPVRTDADWAAFRVLRRLDDVEGCEKARRPVWSEAVTDQIVGNVRAKAPAVQFFLARVDGVDRAYFSSYPGVGGTGMVEDLFTHPDLRNRGLARALIHHCVADARARGAGPVLIGAGPDDTPKQLYARLGFRPTCLTWGWLREGVNG